ncbi:hypothetical protein B0T25DRAFT_289294 [Lasiosphaeria hispida]|uniref:Uncharacterized protein n=1 Tax=Lasiosphaeria hispida TaxID=260671 RepID=A0AAJ0HCJ3_9PEZI|nr:hypothetical protein B0T25DRAFT_289294 [Lasiosphaeria hispida]
MGLIKKAFFTGVAGTAGVVGYLGATTTVICPLPSDDPVFRSESYAKYNIHRNASTQDIIYKRIPLSKIRPELLKNEGDLAVEFCRGVWGGLGTRPQRAYLARKYQSRATSSQLWTAEQLDTSTYEPGTQLIDHFEVIGKTPTEIVLRAGDSPRNGGPRDSDGLFIISSVIDEARNEVVLGLKTCFFTSARKVEGIHGPMPTWMEGLHRWYARYWMATGSWRVTK